MPIPTPDLCDAHPDEVQIVEPLFQHFGGRRAFAGPMATVKVFEDNVLVRARLETPGQGRVLVVDGGGSRRCALLGDKLATFARDNGWAGALIFGCIRDSVEIARIDVGVMALCPHPKKSAKLGAGQQDLPVTFGGVTFRPGHWLYADADGVIVAPRPLSTSA